MPWLSLFWNEFRRASLVRWSYRLDALSWLVIWGIAFPLILLMFDSVSGGYGTDNRIASLVGFLVWDLCIGAMTATTQMIQAEAQEGTLEVVLISPIPPVVIALLRVTAVFTRQLLETMLLGGFLLWVLGLTIPVNGATGLVLLVTMVGVVGVGLFLGGLALVYKNIGSVVGVLGLLALFLTGAILPLNPLGFVFTLLKYSLPTTWGIETLRLTVLAGVNIASLWQDGILFGLLLQAVVFLLGGIYAFRWGFYRAQQQGRLGSY